MDVRSPFSLFPHRRLALALMGCAIVGGWLAAPMGRSQQAAAPVSAEAVAALVGQIKAQQDQMAANQTKIETQAAALKEELRLLKIYSARGGSSSRR